MTLSINDRIMSDDLAGVQANAKDLFKTDRLIKYFQRNATGSFDLDSGFDVVEIKDHSIILKVNELVETKHLKVKYLEVVFDKYKNRFEIQVDDHNQIRLLVADSLDANAYSPVEASILGKTTTVKSSSLVFNSYAKINFDGNLYFTYEEKVPEEFIQNSFFKKVVMYYGLK